MALEYTVTLPESPAKDLDARKLHLTINADPEQVITLPASALSAIFRVERGAAVALFLVDVDTSGNHSQPSPTLAFTATDEIPPPPPGPLVVADVMEVD